MKFGTSIIIFFVGIIAIVAEFILYMIFGIGSIFSGDMSSFSGVVFFFASLMILTMATIILAPICAIIEFISNKIWDISKIRSKKENKFIQWILKDLGSSLLFIFLGLIFAFLVVFTIVGSSAMNESLNSKNTSNNIINSNENLNSNIKITENKNIVESSIKKGKKIDKNKLYIKNNLEIKKFNLTKGYGQFDTPGYSNLKDVIKGTIINNGNKTLDEVKLTLYFLSSENKRISEKDYFPVLVSTYSLSDNKPLKPNYEKDFGYVIEDDKPSNWGGKVEIEITEIKFVK